MRTNTNSVALLLGWILVTVAGWAIGILHTRVNETRSLAEIPAMILILVVDGLLIGLVTGFGQWSLLRCIVEDRSGKWVWATLIGDSLAAPLGLAV